MSKPIKHILKVEIKNLWGKYDLVWNLDPSINVLSGINGSGKSTILDCIASIVTTGKLDTSLVEKKIKQISVTFTNNEIITFQRIKDTIKSLESKAKNRTDIFAQKVISKLKEEEGDNYKRINSIEVGMTSFSNSKMNFEKLHSSLFIDIVSTFDNPLASTASPEERIKTELDREIFYLQKKYLDYQLNIGKKAFEAVSKNKDNPQAEVLAIKQQHERLLEIIDKLFASTNKKVDRNNNELMFLNGKEQLTPYQLSSGEKQILVILLTVLVQDNKSSILFMDEPEISLHIDWQRKLIQYIKELNPNVQIILATHSPGIIMEGWADKVSEMSDLITLDRQAKVEDAK
eukprot:Opistho-2@58382